jgi:hypothetical protein
MRIQSLLLPLTVLIAVGGAFAAGHYIASHDAEKATRSAVALIQAEGAAETFKLASSARMALQASKPEQASQLLTSWAALKAPALIECSAKPECAAWVGPQMPSRAQLEEVIAADRAQRN